MPRSGIAAFKACARGRRKEQKNERVSRGMKCGESCPDVTVGMQTVGSALYSCAILSGENFLPVFYFLHAILWREREGEGGRCLLFLTGDITV